MSFTEEYGEEGFPMAGLPITDKCTLHTPSVSSCFNCL
jgi:hypothetical protein